MALFDVIGELYEPNADVKPRFLVNQGLSIVPCSPVFEVLVSLSVVLPSLPAPSSHSRRCPPTGQAPSQAPQPTHASETLCAIIVLSLSPVRSFMKKPALARRVAGSLGNLILDTILAKQNQKGKTNRTAQNAKLVFLLGCTKAQANFWRKLKRFFGENHEIWLVLAD